MRRRIAVAAGLLLALDWGAVAQHAVGSADAGRRLLAAYPDHLAAVEGNDLIWRDGTRMRLDDGSPPKTHDAWLQSPDLADMFRQPYPAGSDAAAPARNFDPGRARNSAFFRKMYGNCHAGPSQLALVDVAWLPKHSKTRLRVTSVNGVAARLAQVGAELDALPDRFMPFLLPAAGTYNCRSVAGTTIDSAHGYGIAIDIAVKPSDYWRWAKPDASGVAPWRNRIPMEIIRAFEKHGFIWGGRWSHFDTMHFEYRPELLVP